MPGRITIVGKLKSLHQRLFNSNSETEATSSGSNITTSGDRYDKEKATQPAGNMVNKLSSFLQHHEGSNPVDDQSDIFLKVVKLFTAERDNTAAITRLNLFLLTIPLTSVETEQVFSAGLTKIRANLRDMPLEKLIFLRFFVKLKTEKVLCEL